MNSFQKHILICLLFIGSYMQVNAQDNSLKGSVSLGITSPFLDNGIGVFTGTNLAYSLHSRFSLEGQISYMSVRTTSSFLSGKKGSAMSINSFLGGRIYLSSSEKKNRLYINALTGYNYNRELNDENASVKEESELGFSIGAYVEMKKLLIGLAAESPQNLIVRVGYIF